MDLTLGGRHSPHDKSHGGPVRQATPPPGGLFVPSPVASGDHAVPEGRRLAGVFFLPNFSSLSFPVAPVAHLTGPGPLPASLAEPRACPLMPWERGPSTRPPPPPPQGSGLAEALEPQIGHNHQQ